MSPDLLKRLQDLGLSQQAATRGSAAQGAATRGSTAKKKEDLDQSDFLNLMTKQLAQQDPFEPQDNGQFIAQMAQFSTLTAMDKLTNSFAVLAKSLSQGQAVQAASLVGKDVLVPKEFGRLTGGEAISGAVDLEKAAQRVTIDVVNASGATVHKITINGASKGLNEFEWNGKLADGSTPPSGVYQFRATATNGQSNEASDVYLEGEIESVSVNEKGELLIDVERLGEIEFNDIRRIN